MKKNRPLFRQLTPKQVRQIDENGRRILEEIGIHIVGDTVFDRLHKAGVDIDYDNSRVRFSSDCLSKLINHAPPRFTLFSQDGRNDLQMGKGNVYFGNGGRVFRILDMNKGGGYRYTLLKDVINTAILVDHLEYIRFYIIACQAHDLGPEDYHLKDFFCAFNHTTKHVMGGCDDVQGAEHVWKLASLIAGNESRLRERPFVSVITNMTSPLTCDANTLNILDYCTCRGIPVTCAPAPIASATAPVTLAGTLSVMHAEALAGVAITQALTPGAKVLYGAVPATMDLRTMEYTMGAVEMGMMNSSAVQLAKLYDLPIYATSGLTESKRPDIQAGFEKLFSNVTVAMAGADYIHLAAGLMDSGNSLSYEQFVIDNELIGMIHRILTGIRVDEETLGFDVISSVGPGGNYVMEEHTINHMHDEYFYPNLCVRSNFDVWEEKGHPDMLTKAHEIVEKILVKGRESRLEPDLIKRITKAFPAILETL